MRHHRVFAQLRLSAGCGLHFVTVFCVAFEPRYFLLSAFGALGGFTQRNICVQEYLLFAHISLLRFSFAYTKRWLRAEFGCLLLLRIFSFPQNQQTGSNIHQAISVDLS
jgi:hypothetical protein